MKLKKLQEKLKYGEIVIFKDKQDFFSAIGGAGTDMDGRYRRSPFCATKETCLNHIGDNYGLSGEDLKEELPKWKYIESIPPSSKGIPAGTMVTILDNAEEACRELDINWNKYKEEMIGKTCEIKINDGTSYFIYDKDKSDNWLFPRNAFVISTEEEAEEEVTKMTVAEICKELGKEIEIIK